MDFGIWAVTHEGIVNTKDPFRKIFVAKETFLKTDFFEEQQVYEVLLNMMKFEKVSVKSLNVFNYAFLYAAGKFGLEVNLKIFEASVKAQSTLHAMRRIQQLAK